VWTTKATFSENYKCSYYLKAQTDGLAPAMKLASASWVKFQLHWVEWEHGALSANNGLLKDGSADPFHGLYESTLDDMKPGFEIYYPTPLVSNSPVVNIPAYTFIPTGEDAFSKNYNPSSGPPGEIGA
jgi:hypothetical protein